MPPTRKSSSLEQRYIRLQDRPLGGGSFGTVYKYQHRFTKEVVAIKIIASDDQSLDHPSARPPLRQHVDLDLPR